MIIDNLEVCRKKVVSLQTGGTLGSVIGILVDPRDLSIPALFINERSSNTETLVLHTEDIRVINSKHIIVNSYEDIMDYQEIPRLNELVKLDFGLVGCKVKTRSGKKLGRLVKYAIHTKDSWLVSKIFVEQALFKNLASGELMINHTQILETSSEVVIVKDSYSRPRSAARFNTHNQLTEN